MEFTMIPRNLIEDITLDPARVLAYLGISFSRWDGSSICNLVESCGYYAHNRRRNSVTSRFRDLISGMESGGYIQRDRSRIILPRQSTYFATITFEEFTKVMDYRAELFQSGLRINHAHIFLLLACARCYMSHEEGAPHYYSNLFTRISSNIGISPRNVSKCARILETLGILYNEELPRYQDSDGQWHSGVHVFSDSSQLGTLPEIEYAHVASPVNQRTSIKHSSLSEL